MTERAISSLPDRFWSKVDTSGDCWEWQAYRQAHGYGQFTVRKGVFILAHRMSYILANAVDLGPADHICHHCDNPPCVRPDHLFLGNARLNCLDKMQKGRANYALGEASSAAKLTEAQVRYIRSHEYRHGLYSALGRELGVDGHTVGVVHKGGTWRHLLDAQEKAS